jgi:hypothetical protein
VIVGSTDRVRHAPAGRSSTTWADWLTMTTMARVETIDVNGQPTRAYVDVPPNPQRWRPAQAAAAWPTVIASLDRHLGLDREGA